MESIIEQRLVSDEGADPRLVRISVGLEDVEVNGNIPCPFLSVFSLFGTILIGRGVALP